MPTRRLDGQSYEFDDDGFLINGAAWTPVLAKHLARKAGISSLTQKHWTVLSFCREDAATTGSSPSLPRIAELSGISMRELHELFPGDPGELAAKIAGLRTSSLSL